MYIQEIGRAGRDNGAAKGILWYNAADIGTNVVGMQDGIRDYCRADICKRQFIADFFLQSCDLVKWPHDCCTNCEIVCKCEMCAK